MARESDKAIKRHYPISAPAGPKNLTAGAVAAKKIPAQGRDLVGFAD